ncbi:IS701 family transposase [Streptomyces dangxiongensis]|uniref:IS701 family transposase n=1 Tax=Streptomyces dangxiongensis TaxID=1442032 RepID=A0A3G2JEP5_9ACTN|nr:IS701 family transposase [Streptomyces dangxiongensis]AYN40823.1 IS701 family transposase [Streptomyces dangxiongensis]
MGGDVTVDEVHRWATGLDALHARIGGYFRRSEPRRRAREYLRGLLAPLERKNGWTLAEQAGELCPDGMQRLLNQADWSADAVRDEVRGFVLEHLGAEDGVLAVDETGFIKKGSRSAGVQRQYTGTSGKIDNCQLRVFLAYASTKGRALIDRELYLPTSWIEDPARRADARIGAEVVFRTKPALARAMLERAVAARVPFRWVPGDEVYGQDPVLRRWLAGQRLSYVLAISGKHRCGPRGQNARTVSAILPEHAWEIRSAGDGAHGLREYAWALVPLPGEGDDGFEDALLIRRSLADDERAYYLVHAPANTAPAEIVHAAGARWAIEECFQAAKNEAGLDHYQVRQYAAWYRHITLAMAAAAHLAAVRATAHEKGDTAAT